MTAFLKKLALTYLAGLFLFILAYSVFTTLLMLQAPGFQGAATAYAPNFKSPIFTIAMLLAGLSMGAWFYATIRVAITIFYFSR